MAILGHISTLMGGQQAIWFFLQVIVSGLYWLMIIDPLFVKIVNHLSQVHRWQDMRKLPDPPTDLHSYFMLFCTLWGATATLCGTLRLWRQAVSSITGNHINPLSRPSLKRIHIVVYSLLASAAGIYICGNHGRQVWEEIVRVYVVCDKAFTT